MNYWEDRSLQNELKADRYAQRQARLVTRFFNRSKKEMSAKVIAFYKSYATKEGITLPQAKKILNDPKLLQTTLNEYYLLCDKLGDPEVKAYLDKLSAQRAISRQEFLKLQLNLITDGTYIEYENITASTLANEFAESYYKTQYDYDGFRGFGNSFDRLSINQIISATSTNWSGKNYSERIWSQRKSVARRVNRIITTGFITGKSNKQMRQQLEKEVDTSTYNARRLIRTESAYVSGQARAIGYEHNGTKKYEYVATLDLKTSKICRNLDGKVFFVKDKKVGVNYPPMHPHCRSTTAPYTPDSEYDALHSDDENTRAARGADGNTYKVPSNMKYDDWYKKYVASDPKAVLAEKYMQNIYTDKKQFERYKDLLGEDAPKTLEDFQNIKYNDSDLWKKYVSISRSKNYLHTQLAYNYDGEKLFIPKYSTFSKVKAIAGSGTETKIRCVDNLCKTYGGTSEQWIKKVGKIQSDKYVFDVHWYEYQNKQYEPKIKYRKERK